MAKAKGDDKTINLFGDHADLFPVHVPQTLIKALDLNKAIANAMSEAIQECGKSRALICFEMTEVLGYEDREMTVAQLNACTSEARETHNMSVPRLLAFTRVTGATWIWQMILEREGLTLMQGEEAKHAQASLARKQGMALLQKAKELEADAPLTVRRKRR
jgi:hypothetical protein